MSEQTEQNTAQPSPQVQLEIGLTTRFVYATEPASETEAQARAIAEQKLALARARAHKILKVLLVEFLDCGFDKS